MPFSPKMKAEINTKPMNTLFDLAILPNNDPIEDVEITTTTLYMSKPELKEFKRLAKIGIKKLWNAEFQQKGNLTDLLLHLLKKEYEEK